MAPIQVQFEQTPEMTYDMAMHQWKRSRILQWALILLALVGVGLVIAYFLQPDRSSEGLLTAILPLGMILILWRLFIPFTMKLQAKLIDRSSRIGRNRVLTFADDAIYIKTDQSEVTFHYDGIGFWDESARHYFLYIASNQAFIVPKAALALGDDDALLALLAKKGIQRRA